MHHSKCLPHHAPDIGTGGSSRGIADAARGLADVGMSSRDLKDTETSGIGVTLTPDDSATLFGEDQARYLIVATPQNADALRRTRLVPELRLRMRVPRSARLHIGLSLIG